MNKVIGFHLVVLDLIPREITMSIDEVWRGVWLYCRKVLLRKRTCC